jgi:mannose-6-phosphate isomerase
MSNPVPVPLKVAENRVWRFYRGGGQLERLRGRPALDGDHPEEWVGSTTEAAGASPGTGLSRVLVASEGGTAGGEGGAAGPVLRDLIQSDPVGYLGRRHVERFGASPGLLVKLLDPSERLPVHAHPSRGFAREHLGSAFGKTEAWIVLAARDGVDDPHVHLGLAEEVAPDEYRRWVAEQDTERILASLHRLAVQPGDVVFVPAGVPHAIGGGLLIAEVQEETDFSFMCEHDGYPIDPSGAYLGLGLDEGFASLDLRPWTSMDIDRCRIRPEGSAILHGLSDPFFGADRLGGGAERRAGRYELALVVGGAGELESVDARIPLRAGDGVAIPAAVPEWRLEGDLDVLVFHGPAS